MRLKEPLRAAQWRALNTHGENEPWRESALLSFELSWLPWLCYLDDLGRACGPRSARNIDVRARGANRQGSPLLTRTACLTSRGPTSAKWGFPLLKCRKIVTALEAAVYLKALIKQHPHRAPLTLLHPPYKA